MTQAQPQTIAHEILEKIQRTIGFPTDYIDPTENFSYRHCLAECEKLINVSPATGLIIKARLFGWSGSIDAMRECFDKALRYEIDVSDFANYLYGLMDLGFYSEAREGLTKLADPKSGGFNEFSRALYVCGGYRATYSALQEARRLGLEIDPTFEEENVRLVNIAMDRSNLTDELLSQYLDLAGEIMRSKKVIRSAMSTPASVLDMDGTLLVYMSVLIAKDPEFIADMNMDLMELIVENKMPYSDSVLAHFIPV